MILLLPVLANVLGFSLLTIPISFNVILVARSLHGLGQVSANIIPANLSDLTLPMLRPQIFGLMNAVIKVSFILGALLTSVCSYLAASTPSVYIVAMSLSLLDSVVICKYCQKLFYAKLLLLLVLVPGF